MGCYESRKQTDMVYSETRFTSENQFKIYAAIMRNSVEEVKEIIDGGFKVNTMMNNFAKRSPLHIAAQTGSLKIVQLLLKHGADPNLKDPYGITPIFLAAVNHHKECVFLLERSGANLRVETNLETSFEDYIPKGDKILYKEILAR